MSIDDIMKKSKLSLDQMHDTKDVGKTASQHVDQQDKKTTIRELENRKFKTDYRTSNHSDKQSESKYTKKMTFWMTEEVYDAFNEIHAKRTIAKKRVDKGALFCEMVQFFAEYGEENV